MAHTYTLNLLHVVFSTKNRVPMIRDLAGLVKNLRGIARNTNLEVMAAGGTSNHVHLLLRVSPTRALSEAVRDLKANSSRYMSETGIRFAWQDGYAGVSVSPSQVPRLRTYIENQERHHAKRTDEEELRALLDKAGVKYEKEYLV
jgi:putative transposase